MLKGAPEPEPGPPGPAPEPARATGWLSLEMPAVAVTELGAQVQSRCHGEHGCRCHSAGHRASGGGGDHDHDHDHRAGSVVDSVSLVQAMG